MAHPELNPEQQKAATAPSRPLLIVAGAGTGKTRTLMSRIIHLITKEGVSPEKICALTFTNKAAKEMLERIERSLHIPKGLTGPGDIFGGGPFLGTFHSFGSRVLRREAKHLGRNMNFAIYDDGDSFTLVKKIVKSLKDETDETPSYFAEHITALKNGMMTFEEVAALGKQEGEMVRRVFGRYEEALQANNAFDFDDLIDKVVILFKNYPDVLERYRRRFTHFLVDEYQDLNNRQYDLIRLLAGDHKNVSVVGDDQQTIYSWRGSNFEIFLNFERDWPDAQVVLLEENYRSSGNIIAAASELISHNSKQKKKKLWTKNEPGEMVRLIETADEEDEAAWLVEDIMEARRAAPEESIAILYRTNAQSRPLEQALIEEQIPYRIYGGLKFYERREVKDIVAALRYAANPLDSVSRERLEKEFTKTRFRALEPRLRESGALRPTEIIELFIRETDYYTYIAKNLTNILDRRENIAELIRFAAEFEELPPLLEHVSLVQSTDTPSSEQGSRMPVQLMTMHLAKGLEFDRVYIVGVNEGLLPHNRSTYNLAELEEERRLMYVGMTRARKHLALSFYDVPSRFLSEIPSEYLDFKSQVSDAEEFSDDEERYITYD